MLVSAVQSDVTFDELRSHLGGSSFVLLNVLPREAFVAEHIPGSVSLPVAELSQRARETISDLAKEIIVYCQSFT